MNKRINKEDHDMMRLSRNFQRGNLPEQRKALVQALLAKEAKDRANKAADILYEAFGKDFALVKQDGFRKYHITRKDIAVQLVGRPLIPVEGKTVLGEGQMIMTVNNKGKLMIRLNSDTGDVMYQAENLDNEDLKNELPALKAFIETGAAMPDTSKFIAEKNTSDYDDDDVEALLNAYENDPEWSKPQ